MLCEVICAQQKNRVHETDSLLLQPSLLSNSIIREIGIDLRINLSWSSIASADAMPLIFVCSKLCEAVGKKTKDVPFIYATQD